jgi:hypothetical protein
MFPTEVVFPGEVDFDVNHPCIAPTATTAMIATTITTTAIQVVELVFLPPR